MDCYIESENERLGRPLYACSRVFGCQMNAEHKKEKVRSI